MSAAAIIAIVLKLLPQVLSLINRLVAFAHDRKMIEAGRLQAIAEQTTALNRTISLACAAEQEAAEAHAKDPTDGAFDQTFRRD